MNDFCKKAEIPVGTPEVLKALYVCQDATNCLLKATNFNKEASDTNTIIGKNFEKDLSDYRLAKTEFNAKLDRWEKKIGEYSEFSKRDGVNRQFWAADYDNGLCRWDQNGGAANDACQAAANKQGYNGDSYFAKQWGHCWSTHGAVNFLCKKPEDVTSKETSDYLAIKPIFSFKTSSGKKFDTEPKQSDYPLIQQVPIDADISCCTNYLNAGVASDNVQTCNKVVQEKIKEAEKPRNSEIPFIPATSTSPLAVNIDDAPVIETETDYTIGIIIAIVIAFVLLLSSSLLLVVSRK